MKNRKVTIRGFTLVELMIVVAILGILAAIVMPEFQGHTQKAKESAAKENIRIIRQQLELYNEHKIIDNMGFDNFPKNPFNNLATQRYIDSGGLPASATGEYGWILAMESGKIVVALDWPGTDSNGVRYYDY